MSTQWLEQALLHIRAQHGDVAHDRIAALGLPNHKTESWLHAGFREFFSQERRIITDAATLVPSKTCEEATGLLAEKEHTLVFWNGVYLPDLSHLPNGVTVTLENADILESTDLFALLPAYISTQRTTIRIAENLLAPLRVIHCIEGTLPSLCFQNTAWQIAEHVQAEIFMDYRDLSPEQEHMLCMLTSVVLERGSRFSMSDAPSVQLPTVIHTLHALVADDAHFARNILAFSNKPHRETQAVTQGARSSSRTRGITLQHTSVTSFHSTVKHLASDAESDQAFRSAVFQDGRVAVDMTTEVTHDAPRTQAMQESRHLLLQPGARAFSIPRLIINTDDVQCKHGATVGHADSEQIAYMRARGIGIQRARSLLALGHLTTLLEDYPQAIQADITAKLRASLLLA